LLDLVRWILECKRNASRTINEFENIHNGRIEIHAAS